MIKLLAEMEAVMAKLIRQIPTEASANDAVHINKFIQEYAFIKSIIKKWGTAKCTHTSEKEPAEPGASSANKS